MGKHNKQHHHKKDRKHKRERSKKEHLLRKEKEKKVEKVKNFEENRYSFDDTSLKKLVKILRDLLSYSSEALEAVVQVFQMLDEDQELEITDIQDGTLREALEKLFQIFQNQIETKEDSDGRVSYSKSGRKSLKDQILNFIEKAKSAPNIDHLSELFSPLQNELKITEKMKKNLEITVSREKEKEIRDEIFKHDEGLRSKSLLEMHQEKNFTKSSKIAEELYGNKSLNKRFTQGKFLK